MQWESVGKFVVAGQGSESQRFPLSVASPIIRARGLNFNPKQLAYIRIGYLRVLSLDGDEVLSTEVIARSKRIEIPRSLPVFLLEFQALRWIDNASVIVEKLAPESAADFLADIDYVDVVIPSP